MSYEELPAPSDTRDLVRAVWRSDHDPRGPGEPPGARPHTLILPDGCTDVIFLPSRKSIRVVGVMSRALDLSGDAPSMFGLRLEPWAAHAILGFSAGKARDRIIRLEDVNAPLAGVARRVDSHRALLDMLSGTRWRRTLTARPDARVLEAAKALETNSNREVQDLARTMGISERHLHRLFIHHVGLAPKSFARVMRLRDAVRASHTERGLAAIAMQAGYADHAHFCREVRVLTGLAPRAFLERRPQV